MAENTYFKQSKIKQKEHCLFIDSEYGPLKVWYDENGIYVDLYNQVEGDICLVSVHPEDFGILARVYENYGEVTPTKRGYFYDVKNAYKNLMLDIPDEETEDDFLARVFA